MLWLLLAVLFFVYIRSVRELRSKQKSLLYAIKFSSSSAAIRNGKQTCRLPIPFVGCGSGGFGRVGDQR